ncbi:MAG: hypothetical protein WC002_05460 [Candidatus Muiribacteriota bacterium]|jgi:hypothetical protein
MSLKSNKVFIRKILEISLFLFIFLFISGCAESGGISNRTGVTDFTGDRSSEFEDSNGRMALNEILLSIPDGNWDEKKSAPEIQLIFSYPSSWSVNLDLMEKAPNKREVWYKTAPTSSPIAMAKPGDKVKVLLVQDYETIEETEIVLTETDFDNNKIYLSIYYF